MEELAVLGAVVCFYLLFKDLRYSRRRLRRYLRRRLRGRRRLRVPGSAATRPAQHAVKPRPVAHSDRPVAHELFLAGQESPTAMEYLCPGRKYGSSASTRLSGTRLRSTGTAIGSTTNLHVSYTTN